MIVVMRREQERGSWRGPWVPDINAKPFRVPEAHGEMLLDQRNYMRVPSWYVKEPE